MTTVRIAFLGWPFHILREQFCKIQGGIVACAENTLSWRGTSMFMANCQILCSVRRFHFAVTFLYQLSLICNVDQDVSLTCKIDLYCWFSCIQPIYVGSMNSCVVRSGGSEWQLCRFLLAFLALSAPCLLLQLTKAYKSIFEAVWTSFTKGGRNAPKGCQEIPSSF